MFSRRLSLTKLLQRKSVLLLGPRMTGKSTLLRTALPQAHVIDLLSPSELRRFAAHPEQLGERVAAARRKTKTFVVDEIQRVPELLDEVHRLVELDKELRFVLTGASARKLRRAGTNLLGGRLARAELFPLTVAEYSAGDRASGSPGHPRKRSARPPASGAAYRTLLQLGGLPAVLLSEEPWSDLEDYVGTYLREEIMAESLTRNLGAFARFLETAALCNGEQVVFENVARDAQLPARTVRDHFQLMEDTLLGSLVPAYRVPSGRKAYAGAKFYLFDVGVAHGLLGRRHLPVRTAEYGRAFEHLVWCELRASLAYGCPGASIAYWRSFSNFEVDFVVAGPDGEVLAIEAKATRHVTERDLRGLRAFREECKHASLLAVSEEAVPRTTEDGVRIVPAETFFDALRWEEPLAELMQL